MKIVNIKQGTRYRATIKLTGFERLASNDQVKARFEYMGFTDVEITGTGAERKAEGTWSKPSTSAPIDYRIEDIQRCRK